MERYLVKKEALDALNIIAQDAVNLLATDIKITDENISFKNLPFASVSVNESQEHFLKMKGLTINKETPRKLETQGSDYEKLRTKWVKTVKRNQTGLGVKVALLDTGCNIAHVPVDFAYNFINADTNITDNDNHGTKTTSVVKSSIGIANGCELHHLKIINSGSTFDSAVLAAMDYCVDNNIDIMNMSWRTSDGLPVSSYATALDLCMAADVVCVGSCGNGVTDNGTTKFPASHDGVIAVNSIAEDGTPYNKDTLAPAVGHGVDVSCNGRLCQLINSSGSIVSESGTSFSAPFFVGTFALYKERYGLINNYEVLDLMKKRFIKSSNSIIKNTISF